MKTVAIFEIGPFYDVPDIVRVFISEDAAIRNVPPGFKRIEAYGRWLYYQNDTEEKYLNITTYDVES